MEIAQLKDVAEFMSGGTPSKKVPEYWDGDIPWVTSADIRDNKIFQVREYITVEGLNNSATKKIPENSLLLVTRTGVGKVAQTEFDICISQDFTAIIPDKKQIDLRYLYRFLQSRGRYFDTHKRGATIKGVTREVVAKLEIPLPPLAEQRRIAAILDQADALRQKRRRALARLDDLLQSVFLEMFGDPVRNPMGWEVGKIGDLAESVKYGSSSKAGMEGEYPIIRMGNMTYEGGWDFSSLKYLDLSEKDKEKYLVYSGQILFNRTNSKDLVGKTAVYREEKPMAFAGYLVRMISNERSNPEYVSAFMNTPQTKQFLKEKCRNIVGMANINAKEFQKMRIQIPPIELQEKFSVYVHQVLKNKTKLKNDLGKLDNLFHALQQRAFRGEV